MNYKEAEYQANELRQSFGLSATESVRFKGLLLRENIQTYFKPLDDDFSGMALKATGHRFMLINSGHSLGRQHFSICHELFHLYIDDDFIPHKCTTAIFDKNKKKEYKADSFASHFFTSGTRIMEEYSKRTKKKR